MKKEFNKMVDKEVADRYDPVALMFKERVIIVQGEVNAQMSYNIIAQLKKLEKTGPTEDIFMIINSPGGSVIEGLAMYDVMTNLSCPIHTVGIGMEASMGSILLAAGEHRMMSPNAKLMIHQISGGQQGKASEMGLGMDFSQQLHEDLKNIYVANIGLTHEFWDLALEHDTWLTSQQALKMGFIHEIDAKDFKPRPFASESVREEFQKAKDAKVPATAEAIIAILNNPSARKGESAEIRGELVTALSQFPRFWTEKKKELMAAKAKEAGVANDNTAKATVAPKKKASKGPAA